MREDEHQLLFAQMAESFWSYWRQKQLPEGLPRSGELVVMAEVRRLCCCLGVPLLLLARLPCVISQVRHGQRGGMTTKHEANKYQLYLDRLRAIVDKVVGEAGVVISVPSDPTKWQTPHGPRLGAFELQLFYTEQVGSSFSIWLRACSMLLPSAQGSLRSEVLHSKLATKKWPSTAKLEAALLRQVGPSRSVESNCGTEYAVASAEIGRAHV